MKTQDKKTAPKRGRKNSKTHSRSKVNLFIILALLIAYLSGGFSFLFFYQSGLLPRNNLSQTGASAHNDEMSINSKLSDIEDASAEQEKQSISGTEDEEQKIRRDAELILSEMSLEEKIYQLFIVTQEQLTGFSGVVTQSGETSQNAVQQKPVGGIIYFKENLNSTEQVINMIANIQSASKLGLFISVDEEGGRVSRLTGKSDLGVSQQPSMLEVGKNGTKAAYKTGKQIGAEIKRLGFNLDFAPVADIFSNSENTVISDRAFSTNSHDAAELVSAVVDGFHNSKMLCTLKHFPGHGDTTTDSHVGLAYSDKSFEELQKEEFLPFISGIEAGADFIMIGHICVPQITGESVPSTLSYEMVTKVLRQELGFNGVIITDAMNMGAITTLYNSGDAAVKAIKAGVDMILMPMNFSDAVDGINKAVSSGELSEERINDSVERILEIKLRNGIILPSE